MDGENKVAFAADGNHLSVESASSVPPHVEPKCLGVEKKITNLVEQSETLKVNVDASTSKSEQSKAEPLQELRNRGPQLLPGRDELSLLGKKMVIQETDLRRAHRRNEALKEELESTRKDLLSVKQGAHTHRAKQQNLKVQMDQVVRERDDLNDKWQRCKTDCLELHERIANLQSSLSKKDDLCKEQKKLIHLLQQEKEKLGRQVDLKENDAQDQRRALRKCEEELLIHKRRLKQIKICRELEDELGIQFLEAGLTPQQPARKSVRQARRESVESSEKKLAAQTEELSEALKTSEELKQKLTKMASQLHRCQLTVRDQKVQLQAVTAQRNMYESTAKNMELELARVTKCYRSEKLKNMQAKRRSEARQPRRDQPAQDDPVQVPSRSLRSSETHLQPELIIIGKKI